MYSGNMGNRFMFPSDFIIHNTKMTLFEDFLQFRQHSVRSPATPTDVREMFDEKSHIVTICKRDYTCFDASIFNPSHSQSKETLDFGSKTIKTPILALSKSKRRVLILTADATGNTSYFWSQRLASNGFCSPLVASIMYKGSFVRSP